MKGRAAAMVTVAGLLLAGCNDGPWTAVGYPNKDDLSAFVVLGEYDSFEACQFAAHAWVRQSNRPENVDYECGSKCRNEPSGSDILMCKETRQ